MFSWLTYYIRQYFGFSRGQTYGVVVLLLLLALSLVTPVLIHRYEIQQGKKETIQNAAMLDVWVKVLQQAKGNHQLCKTSSIKSKLFFDINTVLEEDLKKCMV